MNKIFISYTRADIQIARDLCSVLEAHNFQFWIDYNDLDPGKTWTDQIRRAVESCEIIICLVNGETFASNWTSEPFRLAEKYRKLIVPIFTQASSNLPDLVYCYKGFDLTSQPDVAAELMAHLHALTAPKFRKARQRILDGEQPPSINDPDPQAEIERAHNLALFIRHRLDQADDRFASESHRLERHLSQQLDISPSFAQALLHGTFPVGEIDDLMLQDIATILDVLPEPLYRIVGREQPSNPTNPSAIID